MDMTHMGGGWKGQQSGLDAGWKKRREKAISKEREGGGSIERPKHASGRREDDSAIEQYRRGQGAGGVRQGPVWRESSADERWGACPTIIILGAVL